MANVLGVVWFVVLYLAAQTSLMVWAALLFPGLAERARDRMVRRPVGTVFLGAAFWLLSLVVLVALLRGSRAAPLQLLGWFSAGPVLACSIVGGAGLAQLAAARVRDTAPAASPLFHLMGGALLTTLATLLPIIGWIVVLPLTGFLCVGAGISALAGRERRSRTEGASPSPDSVREPGAGWAGVGYGLSSPPESHPTRRTTTTAE